MVEKKHQKKKKKKKGGRETRSGEERNQNGVSEGMCKLGQTLLLFPPPPPLPPPSSTSSSLLSKERQRDKSSFPGLFLPLFSGDVGLLYAPRSSRADLKLITCLSPRGRGQKASPLYAQIPDYPPSPHQRDDRNLAQSPENNPWRV